MIVEINVVGNDTLRQPSVAVEPKPKAENSFIESLQATNVNSVWPDEVVSHIQDLKDTLMVNENGIGLASNQIWKDEETSPLRIFVIKALNENKQQVIYEFINPRIVTSGKYIKVKESCLSVPNVEKVVKRKQNVTIEFQTLASTEKLRAKFDYDKHGIIPIVIQHEYDHLLGRLLVNELPV